jgi:hypothetical protein
MSSLSGQDYQDSITFPEGNNRGSCVFAQTAVMSKKSSRDTRQQSRMVSMFSIVDLIKL